MTGRLSIEKLIEIAKYQSPVNYFYMKRTILSKEHYFAFVFSMPKSHLITFPMVNEFDSLNFLLNETGLTIAFVEKIENYPPMFDYHCRFESRDPITNLVISEREIISQFQFIKQMNIGYSNQTKKYMIERSLHPNKSQKKYSMSQLVS